MLGLAGQGVRLRGRPQVALLVRLHQSQIKVGFYHLLDGDIV